MVYQRPAGKLLAGRFLSREVARKLTSAFDRKSKERFLPPIEIQVVSVNPQKNIVTSDNARAF